MKILLVTAAVALLGGVAVRIGFGAQVIGPIMPLLLVVLPIVGLLATIDDDLPAWRDWKNWADLVIRAALCGIGFAIDNGWRTPSAIVPWIFVLGAIAALATFGGRIYRSSSDHTEGQAG